MLLKKTFKKFNTYVWQNTTIKQEKGNTSLTWNRLSMEEIFKQQTNQQNPQYPKHQQIKTVPNNY